MIRRFGESLDRAIEYLLAHVYDDVFFEDTKQSGAERFALKVTYWKDSELNVGGERREPTYPVAYALPHFQCQAALRVAARLTRRRELRERAARMVRRGFETFWRGDHFAVAVQGDGTVVDAPSSDSLHSLLYLREGEIAHADAERIVEYSEQLATDVGYLPALAQAQDGDDYHTRWVWVHEQALLHAAARRHGLARAEVVAFARAVPLYDVQITVLTAFPGTPLYRRLLSAGRILEPARWDLCTLFDVNYRPSRMSARELRQGIHWLTERLYAEDCTADRRRGFFEAVRRGRRARVQGAA